jgi:hypothetical protein
MATCTSCGADVTGKKFCPECGTPAQPAVSPTSSSQPASSSSCPRCSGEVKPGAAFCMHCGSVLSAPAMVAQPSTRPCPACRTEVPVESAFCTNCGQNMQVSAPSMAQPVYPQQYGQMGYQQDSMLGQQPMVLRCPVCMAMAPVGTPNCPSCQSNLAGVVPTPANIPAQGQQGGFGGFLQGSGGKMAMGALGGAAAVIGGEMLLHGIEKRVEGDIGYGGEYHHRQYDDQGNPLGEIGEIAKDIGLL